MTTLTLYHVTSNQHRASIQRRGLLTQKAQGKRPAVYLTTHDGLVHAIATHGQKHNGNIAIVKVRVPRDAVTRYRGDVFYSKRNIPPTAITGVFPNY